MRAVPFSLLGALLTAPLAAQPSADPAALAQAGFTEVSEWITKAADLVNAAVPICGMYQLAIDYDETGMPHGRDYSEEMMGGTPAEQPERYRNASPANFIDRIKGRLMIVHGLKDSNVSPENTRAAVRDLDRAGIPYTLLTFDNEGHGIYRASNREVLFQRIAAFFAEAFGS